MERLVWITVVLAGEREKAVWSLSMPAPPRNWNSRQTAALCSLPGEAALESPCFPSSDTTLWTFDLWLVIHLCCFRPQNL